jgi:hypothetical protein
VLLRVIEGRGSITSTSRSKNVSMEPAIDGSGKVYIPMTRTIKASLLFSVFALCALGAIFSPKENRENRKQPTQVVPVNNHQSHRGIWLRV